jgi:glutathione S-transferase
MRAMTALYHWSDCPYCFKVRFALAEAGVGHESILVDRAAPPPELAALAPLGRLPVWIGADRKPVFGSNTIIDYIAGVQRAQLGPAAFALLPSDPLARARCWMADELADVGLLQPLLALDALRRESDDPAAWDMQVYRRHARRAQRTLDVLAALLGQRDWLVGDTLTYADVAVALPLTILERFGLDLAPHPALAALAERLASRPCYKTARWPERDRTEGRP